MARHTISISNGKGSIRLVNGTYKVTAVVEGYSGNTISPSSVSVVEGTDSYVFKISAVGVLTLHVTDTGVASGTQVVGARFVRTDSSGNVLGDEVVTNESGNAVFNGVPYASSGNIMLYYKQIASDGGHTFSGDVKSVKMTDATYTVEVSNPDAPVRSFSLTDASFPNVLINEGQIILEDS
jgi:hypothetical protein